MDLQVCEAWSMNHCEVGIGEESANEKKVRLSEKLLGKVSVNTVFLLNNKTPKLLGLINSKTGELCLGYETKEGVFDQIPGPTQQSIEQKMLECFI